MVSLRRRLSVLFGLWAVGTAGPPAGYLANGLFTGAVGGEEAVIVAGFFLLGTTAAAVGLPTEGLAERFRAGTELGLPMLLARGRCLRRYRSVFSGVFCRRFRSHSVGRSGFWLHFSSGFWPTRPSSIGVGPRATSNSAGKPKNGRKHSGFARCGLSASSQRSVWPCLSGRQGRSCWRDSGCLWVSSKLCSPC